MARWNKSDKARIEMRRLSVEQLSARGLGLWEIVNTLEEMGVLNPRNDKPYSIATISRDLAAIEERWKEKTVQERDDFKAEQLKELRAARRAAWKEQNYSEVRRNIETEMKLLGTEAPNRQEITGADGEALIPIRAEQALEKVYGDSD